MVRPVGISVHGSAYRPHHVRGSSTRYNPYPTPTYLITNNMLPGCVVTTTPGLPVAEP